MKTAESDQINTYPQWLEWAHKLQAVAQNGLGYASNPHDRLRYQEVNRIAAQILSSYTNLAEPRIIEIFDSQEGYATPKLDVRGVVFLDNKILLVKELSDGGWTLPGGWVDVGEPPSLAVEREVFEESGFIVHADKLLAVYDRNLHGHPPHPFHIYKLFFRCVITGGAPADSIETAQASFFSEHEIPPLSLGRTTPQQIMRFFESMHNPDEPTDFD
jgi:ADP-ribose pyrophosphatase YjhB (NUDIX family)